MLLHGAVEEEADPTAPSPMAAAAAPEKGPAQKEKGQAAGSGSLSGGEAARNSSTPEPVENDESQDDRDLVHLVTVQSHGSEVCPIFTSYSYSSRGEAGLPDTTYTFELVHRKLGRDARFEPILIGQHGMDKFVGFVFLHAYHYTCELVQWKLV